jgi:hypothetical protein
MTDIVIAHYNENLSWLQKLSKKYINKIYIYSKYEDDQNQNGIRLKNINLEFLKEEYFKSLSSKVTYYHIPNVGRESETYLRYCVEQYNNLAEHTLFLQGEPHMRLEHINSLLQQFHDKKLNISDNFEYFDGIFLDDGHLSNWYGQTELSDYNFYTWFRTYVDQEMHLLNGLKVYFGACFGVSKKHIQSRSIEFYQQIIDETLKTRNPETAHFLERLWFYIFNCHIIT